MHSMQRAFPLDYFARAAALVLCRAFDFCSHPLFILARSSSKVFEGSFSMYAAVWVPKHLASASPAATTATPPIAPLGGVSRFPRCEVGVWPFGSSGSISAAPPRLRAIRVRFPLRLRGWLASDTLSDELLLCSADLRFGRREFGSLVSRGYLALRLVPRSRVLPEGRVYVPSYPSLVSLRVYLSRVGVSRRFEVHDCRALLLSFFNLTLQQWAVSTAIWVRVRYRIQDCRADLQSDREYEPGGLYWAGFIPRFGAVRFLLQGRTESSRQSGRVTRYSVFYPFRRNRPASGRPLSPRR